MVVAQALTGFTVLELGYHVAAPFATKLLAGYGAEVIKIEPPEGDPTRRWGPFPSAEPHPEKSGTFLYLNTGKKSVTLDLKTVGGRILFSDLVKISDLFITNLDHSDLDLLNISLSTIHSINPRICTVFISNFGTSGPWRDFTATGLTVFAAGGQMALTGDPDREPLKNFGHQAEYQAGFQAFGAALSLLFNVITGGEADMIEISIQEVQASALEMNLPNALNHGIDVSRSGNTVRATWGIYPCKDGYIGISALDRNLPAVFRAIGRPELLETYKDPTARAQLNDALEALIYSWCAERTKQEIFEIALKEQAPFSYIPTIDELLEWPALREKGFWSAVDHPIAGRFTYPGGPFTMSTTPYRLGRAPLLGEHNEEIFCKRLGYSHEDLQHLRQMAVI